MLRVGDTYFPLKWLLGSMGPKVGDAMKVCALQGIWGWRVALKTRACAPRVKDM